MASIDIPKCILSLMSQSFVRARESGALTFYPSEAVVLRINSIPFALRFSPALANKPNPPPRLADDVENDPFANPPPDLTVAPIGPSHVLLLNKFAVVAGHCILATRAFAPQTDLLEERDVAAVAACILAAEEEAEEAEGGLFAFFNSGPHSGASQPHRHVQLLPTARLRDGLGESEWSVLADALLADGAASKLPFAAFASPLPTPATPSALHATYLALYRRACVAVGVPAHASQTAGPAAISYNLAMTRSVLALCPRTAEGAAVQGTESGFLGLNGTVLAGMALVKTREEWDALRENPERLGYVLACIGA